MALSGCVTTCYVTVQGVSIRPTNAGIAFPLTHGRSMLVRKLLTSPLAVGPRASMRRRQVKNLL